MTQQTQSALIDTFIVRLARIRFDLVRMLIELFSSPGSWRDADVDRFVARAVPLVEGAQRAAATLTDDFLSRMVADQTGAPYRPRGVDYRRVTGAAVRNGVAPEQVYRRPFQEVWASLAETERQTERRRSSLDDALRAAEEAGRATGERRARVSVTGAEPTERERRPLTVAVTGGERRVKALALTDIELAVTHTTRERLATEPQYRFFRRVLTGAESCGLCIVASTQRYFKQDLMPIHPGCDCVVAPILADQDPGQVVNTMRVAPDVSPTGATRSGVPVYGDDQLIDTGQLLDEAHEAVRREFGEAAFDARSIDYRKILLVRDHGELGPVLTVARHKFTKRQMADRNLAAR